jgi:deoxyribodipyrimidine photo-lyase
MATPPPTLLWFKRDLRIDDHPALAHAAAAGPVLPVYVVEPAYWQLADTSYRQWAFTAECLSDLQARLGELGQPLVLRVGEAVTELSRLCRQHGIDQLISHEETGNAWTYARDRRVQAWARGAGIIWTELPQSAVVRRLASRDGWARQRTQFMARQPLPAPTHLPLVCQDIGRLPSSAELGVTDDDCSQRQRGGRAQAMALLDSFLHERGQPYRSAMSSPLAGEWACSRVSPHLAMGALSVREAVHALETRRQQSLDFAWRGSLKSFASRLAWRDHFMQKLEDQPSLEQRCLHPATEGLRERGTHPERLHAWQTGRTGWPFVDACMRSLNATGWLNFRMRAMLMSVAAYHLWLDWRDAGPHLARLFTDYEPGIHWSQCQMQSGTTGINAIRIYNPIKQGQDQDPDGVFIRRWVPELAALPDSFIHQPWLWPKAAGKGGYPAPLVEVVQAGRQARERVWALRKQAGFRAQAKQVASKHASRKRRRSSPQVQPDNQLSLKL